MTPEKTEILNYIHFILSVVSLVFIIFSMILFLFLKVKKTNTSFRIEIIAWLMISCCLDLSTSFFPINIEEVEYKNPNLLCKIQSSFNTFFGTSTPIFCTLIGYTAYVNVIKPEHIDNHKCLYRSIFLSVGFCIPLAMTVM